MKVALVGSYPEPECQVTGGVERVVEVLRREFASRVDLTVFVPGADADRDIHRDGTRVVYLRRGPGPGVVRYTTFDAWKLAGALDNFQPDIVHIQGAAGVARYVRQPLVVTVHGLAERDFIAGSPTIGPVIRFVVTGALRSAERSGRRRAGAVIVINPYVTDVLPDVRALRHFEIPNPIDREFCSGAQDRQRPRSIISVGRIGPLKDTLRIVEVVGRVIEQDPSATLTICGTPVDEGYAAACRQAVADMGIADRVFWAGNLDTPALIAALDKASCLIMASRQENAPMAIAEANARGVAAVAPEAFGIRYMIRSGENGLFLPAGDLYDQAAVVRAALDHDWDRRAMMEKAHRIYGPRAVADATLAAYRAILGNSEKAV